MVELMRGALYVGRYQELGHPQEIALTLGGGEYGTARLVLIFTTQSPQIAQ